MTVLSRGARARRGGRRPGWVLLTVLLVLAIGASSALVFTNRVELLKLAVILALWAAVVGAFVSVIYRRQSDADQAKVRDLKLVYDLQLDREISTRREYELSVETHLRRELASELRAQSADEVAALRAELAALRTNLEILFDTDLAHRPAIETDRTYQPRPDRVSSSRVTPVRDERRRFDERGESAPEDPIIDVPEEPLIQPPRRSVSDAAAAEAAYRGSHRRPSEETTVMPTVRPGPPPPAARPAVPTPSRPSAPSAPIPSAPTPSAPTPVPPAPRLPEPPAPTPEPPVLTPEPPVLTPEPPAPTPEPQPEPVRRGRHSGTAGDAAADAPVPPEEPRGRHWVGAPETVPVSEPEAAEPEAAEPEAAEPAPAPEPEPEPPAKHRGADDEDAGPPTGGQSVAELLARLQASTSATGGGRRRRRDDD